MVAITYEKITSSRAKYPRLAVMPNGNVVVTVPAARAGIFRSKPYSDTEIDRWVRSKRDWIVRVQEDFRKKQVRREKRELKSPRIPLPKMRRGTKAYAAAREDARRLVIERLAHFNAFYGFRYGTISIRDQKTRWGSCSAAGNLAFNFRIVHIAPELADYLVVHELCHTKHHNHSKEFWAEVEKTIPDYNERRKELKRYSF